MEETVVSPVSEADFQRGRAMLINGFQGLFRLYSPYIDLFEGVMLLGLQEFWRELTMEEGQSENAAKLLEHLRLVSISMRTLLSSLGQASTTGEIKQALRDSFDLMGMFWESRT